MAEQMNAVTIEIAGGVATLTMDLQSKRNALAPEIVNGLGDAFAAATDDPSVRAIVLTNAGNTFCAGADLRGGSEVEPRYDLVELFGLMQGGPKPVVGRIAGHCTGGGVGLAAACDISVAADDVQLGFTEVRIGVAPAMISVVCLPKMRRADALELFLSGEKISSTRAVEVGLLNHAVPRAELDRKVKEIVGKLVRGGPTALAASKALVFDVPDWDRDDAFARTSRISMDLFTAPEAAEGMASFREKRPASWVPTGGDAS